MWAARSPLLRRFLPGLNNLRGICRGRVAAGLHAGLTGAQPVIRKRAASGEACAIWLLPATPLDTDETLATRRRRNELRDRRASTASFLHLSACVAIWAVISFWFCKGGHLITMRDPVVRLPIAYYVRGGKLRLALISASSAPLRRIKRRGNIRSFQAGREYRAYSVYIVYDRL